LAKLEPGRAVMYYERAIQAEEKASGKDHPRVAALLSNLALRREEEQDFRSAENLLRRVLAIQEKSIGRNHYQTAATMSNLGVLLAIRGELRNAEAVEREAVNILEEKRPRSVELAGAYYNLGKVLEAGGERVPAAGNMRKSIGVNEVLYGAD